MTLVVYIWPISENGWYYIHCQEKSFDETCFTKELPKSLFQFIDFWMG